MYLDRIDDASAPAPSCAGGHSPSEGRAFFRTPDGWEVARTDEISEHAVAR
jgi:hypothetical protein